MSFEQLAAAALCGFAKILTGVRAVWIGSAPNSRQRVYYANHRSHGDFVLIWTSLPPNLRRRTRPVAGADYWLTSALRRYIANQVFRGVLIERKPAAGGPSPVDQMRDALAAGDSLIIFPEGTRNLGDGLLPFKSGLYHLANAYLDAELVPVWIENLGRVMPKGSLVPIPLLCSLTFGPSLNCMPGESKAMFLDRARTALLALAPPTE